MDIPDVLQWFTSCWAWIKKTSHNRKVKTNKHSCYTCKTKTDTPERSSRGLSTRRTHRKSWKNVWHQPSGSRQVDTLDLLQLNWTQVMHSDICLSSYVTSYIYIIFYFRHVDTVESSKTHKNLKRNSTKKYSSKGFFCPTSSGAPKTFS